jgi:predicted MFS family arabinose efflux permease
VGAPWQLYAAFVVMGQGYAVLSLTGLSATIAPWFERHQGRSVAVALMGASVGAVVGVPLLVFLIQRFGFADATLLGAGLIAAVLVPAALVVLRFRRPAELGLGPDGDPPGPQVARAAAAPATWTRHGAMRTAALWTVALAFASGLLVQVGFLTHHLKIAEPTLGAAGAGWLIAATGAAGLLGRLLLARVADRVDVRRYTGGIFAAQAVLLALIGWVPGAPVLILASLGYGFCLGQITTLSPIVVRREFGAGSFGAIYSVAGTVIQVSSALGPAFYGALRDAMGSYPPVLAIAAGFELAAMLIILAGRAPVRPG